jgi:ABC-type dipeptide/oligopeptide/nickel transport system permease subunit
MIASTLFLTIFGNQISKHNPEFIFADKVLNPPDSDHVLGTDDIGKDIFAQLIAGAQISLSVGLIASLISICISFFIGTISGYYGNFIDNLLMRLTDFFMVVPMLPIIIILSVFGNQTIWKIIIIIGIFNWPSSARLIRSKVLIIKESDYVSYSLLIGASNLHILKNHIIPQIIPTLLVLSILDISNAILAEAALSFLGLGDPTRISWGQMLHYAFERSIISDAWWTIIPPGFSIIWISVGSAFLGRYLDHMWRKPVDRHFL